LTVSEGALGKFTQYDAVGNLVESVSAGGLISRMQYDTLGRTVERRFEQLGGRKTPGTVAFAYDVLGRMVSAANDAASVTRRYDTLGNLAGETVTPSGGNPWTVNAVFTNKGLRSQLMEPGSSNPFSYLYDDDGRVTAIRQNGTDIAAFDYLGNRITGRHYANGVGASIAYDDTGRRPETIALSNGGKSILDSRTYTWDASYNIEQSQVTDGPLSAGSISFAYDEINRMTGAGGAFSYTLDVGGNRVGTGSGYTRTGDDVTMDRYTTTPGGQTRRYDRAGTSARGGDDSPASFGSVFETGDDSAAACDDAGRAVGRDGCG